MGCTDCREGKRYSPEGCLTEHLTNVTSQREGSISLSSGGKYDEHAWALVFCIECRKAWREELSSNEIKEHYKDTGHKLYIGNRKNVVKCLQCGVDHSLLLLPERISRVFLELREEFIKGYHNNFRDKH